VLLIGFPAAAFATNCFILAPARGEECLVVDPGIGVEETVREICQEYSLRPAAVLLTHGHLDHVYAVTPVCGGGGVAAYIHRDDRYRLDSPLELLDPGMLWMMEQEFGSKVSWTEPEDIREIADGETLTIAGLDLRVVHAPGHTEGSVMFTTDEVPDEVRGQVGSTVVSGDVLFAGSIGRTDLPGGSDAAMQRSLRELVLPMPDDRLVLPGHGPLTTIGQERGRNPFLQGLR
jgi:hydroxyacylglutathione hydrolase